jgi:hypothetical protein
MIETQLFKHRITPIGPNGLAQSQQYIVKDFSHYRPINRKESQNGHVARRISFSIFSEPAWHEPPRDSVFSPPFSPFAKAWTAWL